MKKALILCREGKMLEAIQNGVASLGCSNTFTFHSAAEVRAEWDKIQDGAYQLAVVNAPLEDEFGSKLVKTLYESLDIPSLFLVPGEHTKAMTDFLTELPCFVIPKPVNVNTLEQSIQLSFDAFQKMAILNRKNRSLQEKLDDLKVIDRAKCTLIAVLNMSESQAHRYIQKKAMDERVKPRVIADNILRTYEY